MYISHEPQAAPEALSNAATPANDVPHRGQQRAVLPDRPQPEIAEPSALHEPSSHQLLQSALHGVCIGLHATRDLAGVELLTGRACQQPNDLRSNAAAAEQGCQHDAKITTIVVSSTTIVVAPAR